MQQIICALNIDDHCRTVWFQIANLISAKKIIFFEPVIEANFLAKKLKKSEIGFTYANLLLFLFSIFSGEGEDVANFNFFLMLKKITDS